jgi:hypothetical protein
MDTFAICCLFLDAFGILVIYLVMNPSEAKQLKRKLLFCRSTDDVVLDDVFAASDPTARSHAPTNNIEFSEYHNAYEISRNHRLDTNRLSTSRKIVDQEQLSELCEKDLIALIDGGDSAN